MTTTRAAIPGRPFTTDLTAEQRRKYARLAASIGDAIDDGKSVPCLRLPTFFDLNLTKPDLTRPRSAADGSADRAAELAHRRELAALRERLCRQCPVLQQCGDYANSGVQVYGFLAGSWCRGR